MDAVDPILGGMAGCIEGAVVRWEFLSLVVSGVNQGGVECPSSLVVVAQQTCVVVRMTSWWLPLHVGNHSDSIDVDVGTPCLFHRGKKSNLV